VDGSGEALGVEAHFKLDKVDLGALTAVAADGEAPMAGIASGSLTASAVGVSPRALVQDLKGNLVFKLGKVDVKNAAAGTISAVDLAVDLPGLAQSPSIKGAVVYNKRKVTLDVGLDPLDKVLAGETFALTVKVDSKLLKLSYDGAVQQQPLPGLDGRFNFASPSVGKLAAWLGQPLDPNQPDPGPLKIDAVLKAEGETAVLERAVIEGEGLKAEASGSVDISGEVKKVVLDVKAGMLDIDRYLPPPAPAQEAGEAPAPGNGQRPANPLEAIPDEPIDLAALQGTEADISIALDGLRAAGFELGQTQIGLNLSGGKLALNIGQLSLYGGGVKGRVDLDGSGDALGFASDLSVSSLAVGDLARAAGVEPAPLEGVMTASLKAKSQGKSPRALVAALSADLDLQMSDASLAAMPDMAIGTLDATLAVPALDQATNGKVALTLNGKPLEASFAIDSPQKAMQGEAFGLQVAVTSDLLKASIDGSVQQQPLPGLDGSLDLDVPSVGELATWLGQPLPDGQPDPGPLKIAASLAADGGKMAIKSASITGKAAEASASGSFDGTGEIILFDGKLDVAKLDLNAYLPPPSEAAAPAAEEDGAKGWSEEPIDVSPLRSAEGQVQITLANVLYREVEVQNAAVTVSLSGGVLKADVTKVQLSPGDVTASAVVDGSGDAAGIDYQVALQGVESKPFLKSFADMDILSGKLNLQTKGTARGANLKQIIESLNGAGNFAFLDGAIEGFDLAGTLRNLGQLGMASGGSESKTDFTELSGSYTITDGLLQNGDLMMLAPLVRVTGAGQADLPPQTLDYNVEAMLVASLEGQGSTDALAGLPIPVHAYGPWDSLSYDVDYATMLNAAMLDPERLANLPADIAGQAANFGVNLPGLGGEGTEGGLLEGVLGGTTGGTETGGETGGLGGLLGGAVGGLLGGGESEQPVAEEGPAPTGAGPTPTVEGPAPTQQEEEPSIIPDASKLLKGLFN
jgi:AsmA protein